jgi:streptomycin 6-kinase
MLIERQLNHYLKRWDLIQDGERILTRSSCLLPVRRNNEPAMLKIATAPEEKLGARLMIYWNGIGAAQVIEHEENTILLERATGSRSLTEMAKGGKDDEASTVICEAVADLHKVRAASPPALVPLSDNFRALYTAAARDIFARCTEAAQMLLASPRDVVNLHGDVHHENILDFGDRGWLAIDPKGVMGERGFDYANLFFNPDHKVATAPGRLARQVEIVSHAANLERSRLLHWILAWAGLSAAWLIEDGMIEHVAPTLRIAELAAAEIGKHSI